MLEFKRENQRRTANREEPDIRIADKKKKLLNEVWSAVAEVDVTSAAIDSTCKTSTITKR